MKKLVMVCLVLAGCGTNPYQQELDAYKSYLQGEVSSGRMSLSEGNYRLLQKQNELNTQRQANMANSAAMGALGLSMMNASRPQPIPQSTINCTTIDQGNVATTRCQ